MLHAKCMPTLGQVGWPFCERFPAKVRMHFAHRLSCLLRPARAAAIHTTLRHTHTPLAVLSSDFVRQRRPPRVCEQASGRGRYDESCARLPVCAMVCVCDTNARYESLVRACVCLSERHHAFSLTVCVPACLPASQRRRRSLLSLWLWGWRCVAVHRGDAGRRPQ